MVSVSIDREADVVSVDLLPRRPIVRTVEVGSSLLADYGDDGDRTWSRSCANSSTFLPFHRPDCHLRVLLAIRALPRLLLVDLVGIRSFERSMLVAELPPRNIAA